MDTIRLPTQHQLILPLLEVLRDNGPMRAKDAAEEVAQRIALPAEARAARATYNHAGRVKDTNLFDRQVRWTRQNAVLDGLIVDGRRGIWELADPGHKTLTMARPGVVVAVVQTDAGSILWAEARAAMGRIDSGLLNLVLTSPVYPLNRQREYGFSEWSPDVYMDTLLGHIDLAKPLLANDGSLVLNLADVYDHGQPTLNTYQEELVVLLKKRGWHLCGKQVWHNPCRPKTTPWTTKQRCRMAGGFEMFYWWAPSPEPKANNRHILVPYSAKQQRILAEGGELRQDSKRGSRQSSPGLRYRADNGGAIPQNVFAIGHEGSGAAYLRHCKDRGLPFHPARMPLPLAEQWIQFTTDPGDVVFDPFAGSLTTAAAAQKLGRRFIGSEKCLEYIQGGVFRLEGAAGLKDWTPVLAGGPIA